MLPGLDIFANGGYTSSKITKYSYAGSDVGNWAPYVPLYTANLGVQYIREVAKNVNVFGRFDVEVHGKQYWDPQNDTARKEFNLYNLQVGLTGPQRKWSAVFYVKNLTDKAYNAEYVSGGYAQPAEPRTLGGELSYSY